MKKERLVKGCIAALAAVGLIFSVPRAAEVNAALAINTEEKCSITIQVEGNLNFEGADLPSDVTVSGNDLKDQAVNDLKNPAEPVEVWLYRVAEIWIDKDGSGKYEYRAIGDFAGETGEKDKLKKALTGLDDKTTAQDWRDCSMLAAKIAGILSTDAAEGEAVEVDLTKPEALKADKSVVLQEGKAAITDLSTGLYLVAAGKTHDKDYQREYSFTPYLISLPDNRYYDGSPDGGEGSDEWLKDITVGLKPEIERLAGDLLIKKKLTDKNALMGVQGATSVFHVVVTDEIGGKETKIYDNVVAFRLKEAGNEETITVGKFPAGAKATVTEVYAGAGCEIDGEAGKQGVEIVSDMAAEKGVEKASAAFANKSDGTLTGGYGIVNHFTEGVTKPEEVQKESNVTVTNKTAYPGKNSAGTGGTE